MRILAICGSPRKGNTEYMLNELLKGAEDAGAETELILLRQLKIKHCGGCKGCESTGKCHLTDDMQAIYPKLLNADVLVLGSPNYFDNMSGLLKDFIDRTVPLYYADERLKGKPAILVGAGGSTFKEVISSMKAACRTHGIMIIDEIGAIADASGDAAANKRKMRQCYEAGSKLASLKNKRPK